MKTRMLMCIVALLALVAAGCGSDAVDSATTTVTDSADDAADFVADAVDDAEETVEDAMTDDAVEDDHSDDAMTNNAVEDDHSDDAMTNNAMEEDEAMTDDAMAEGPGRIISLSPTATEILFAIGAGDQVVAVDSFSYFPPEAPVTELSAYEPNLEAIAGFEPDVVITADPLAGLDEVGIENMVAPAATNLDDIYVQIEQFGAMTGHVGEAAELVLQMQTDIDEVLNSLPARDVPLTYYHELDNTLYSVTSETFIGYVYDLFGLVNVADPLDADGSAYGYPQLNEEFLVTANPDIIFLADTLCCEQTAETVAARPGWDQLSAVQNGNIVELNDDIVSRWGPRIVDFIEAVGIAVNELEPVAS